jgi:hypothetical protein
MDGRRDASRWVETWRQTELQTPLFSLQGTFFLPSYIFAPSSLVITFLHLIVNIFTPRRQTNERTNEHTSKRKTER